MCISYLHRHLLNICTFIKQAYIFCLLGALYLYAYAVLPNTVACFVFVEITSPLGISDLYFPVLCECG